MRNLVLIISLLLLTAVSAVTQEAAATHADHAAAPAPANALEWAKQRVDRSPRHREWVNVKSGNRLVSCFVVYPEVKNRDRCGVDGSQFSVLGSQLARSIVTRSDSCQGVVGNASPAGLPNREPRTEN